MQMYLQSGIVKFGMKTNINAARVIVACREGDKNCGRDGEGGMKL